MAIQYISVRFLFFIFLSCPFLNLEQLLHSISHNQWIHKRVGSISCEIVRYPQQLFIFFFLSPFPSSFYTLSFLLQNPQSTSILTLLPSSFLQTTPHSESYDLLCSNLFALLENPILAFLLLVVLTLPLCKKLVAIFLRSFCLPCKGLFVSGMFVKF